MTENQRSLYLDMDDVVADWVSEATQFLKVQFERGTPIPQMDWNRLAMHKRFFKDLPLLPGAKELVAWATEYTKRNNMHFAFLTAIPHDDTIPYAIYDKVRWADKHFPGIPVLFGPYSFDKQMHCKPGDILIDDRSDNCNDWRMAGGIAHEYRTWEKCQHWINYNL